MGSYISKRGSYFHQDPWEEVLVWESLTSLSLSLNSHYLEKLLLGQILYPNRPVDCRISLRPFVWERHSPPQKKNPGWAALGTLRGAPRETSPFVSCAVILKSPHPVMPPLSSLNTFLQLPFDMSSYMSVHAWVSMCMYVCLHLFVYECVCICTCVHVSVYIHAFECTCLCVYMSVLLCVYMCTCVCIYTYAHAYVCVCIMV